MGEKFALSKQEKNIHRMYRKEGAVENIWVREGRGCRKLHSEELRNLNSLPISITMIE
jgi:hypothetical protein